MFGYYFWAKVWKVYFELQILAEIYRIPNSHKHTPPNYCGFYTTGFPKPVYMPPNLSL